MIRFRSEFHWSTVTDLLDSTGRNDSSFMLWTSVLQFDVFLSYSGCIKICICKFGYATDFDCLMSRKIRIRKIKMNLGCSFGREFCSRFSCDTFCVGHSRWENVRLSSFLPATIFFRLFLKLYLVLPEVMKVGNFCGTQSICQFS